MPNICCNSATSSVRSRILLLKRIISLRFLIIEPEQEIDIALSYGKKIVSIMMIIDSMFCHFKGDNTK